MAPPRNDGSNAAQNGSQAGLGKRSRDAWDSEYDERITNAMKWLDDVQARSVELLPDEVHIQRSRGGQLFDVTPSDPRGPDVFTTIGLTKAGGTDIIVDPYKKESWSAVHDVTQDYVSKGYTKFAVIVQPLGLPSSTYGHINKKRDFTIARPIEELPNDEDGPAVQPLGVPSLPHGQINKKRDSINARSIDDLPNDENRQAVQPLRLPSLSLGIIRKKRDLTNARSIEEDADDKDGQVVQPRSFSSYGPRGFSSYGPRGFSSYGPRGLPRLPPGHVFKRRDFSNARSIEEDADDKDGQVVQPWRLPSVDFGTIRKKRDFTGAHSIEEIPYDEDEQVLCEACSSNLHETRICPIPSHHHGDTICDPFCNHSIKAQEKGDKVRHPLDGLRVSHRTTEHVHLYCNVLIGFEREETDDCLRRLFDALVVQRRRMPPIRVVKERYCFIRMTLDVSHKWYQGAMPPQMEGAWPYTKRDALRNAQHFRNFSMCGWMGMPKGELEDVQFARIRSEYETGNIPKQIYVGKNHQQGVAAAGNPAITNQNPTEAALDEIVAESSNRAAQNQGAAGSSASMGDDIEDMSATFIGAAQNRGAAGNAGTWKARKPEKDEDVIDWSGDEDRGKDGGEDEFVIS